MLFAHASSGFTLIELIVVIAVLLLVAGGGIASFINFNEKQQVINGAKNLQEYLRTAQTLARIGDKPNGCDKLNGYKVKSLDAGAVKEIKVLAVCDSGEIERNSFLLPESTTLSSDIEVTFLGLHGGVVGATMVEVIGASARTYTFEITQGGEITLGELL